MLVLASRKCATVTFVEQQTQLGPGMNARTGILPKDETRDPGIQISVRATVATQFEQVALEQKRKLARLSDDLKLLESGLDSLSFALVVVRLEEELGFDPFDSADDIRFPVTFGDFVALYENHAK